MEGYVVALWAYCSGFTAQQQQQASRATQQHQRSSVSGSMLLGSLLVLLKTGNIIYISIN
jgi:uncharacterized BrkB/YihY/UPF0761 family membrane protein